MGLVKTRRLARHSLALGVFASPWVANPRKGRLCNAEAAARKSRDEATDEGRCREGRSASVRASAQISAKGILATHPKWRMFMQDDFCGDSPRTLQKPVVVAMRDGGCSA